MLLKGVIMIYKNELQRMKREMLDRKAELTNELLALPEGVLYIPECDGIRKYYQRLPAKGNRKKERRHGIKSDPKLMGKLVRKEYVTSALDVIDRNLYALDFAARKYRPIDENSIMEQFVNKYPELAGYIYRDSFDPKMWRKGFKSIENYHPENLRHTSADGFM